MKAEIGFQRIWGDGSFFGKLTDRLKLVVQAQTETEGTSLAMFAKRLGLNYDESSNSLTIEEPEAARAEGASEVAR